MKLNHNGFQRHDEGTSRRTTVDHPEKQENVALSSTCFLNQMRVRKSLHLCDLLSWERKATKTKRRWSPLMVKHG